MQISQYGRRAVQVFIGCMLSKSVPAQCIPIERWRSEDDTGADIYKTFKINRPDRYCLTEDIVVEPKVSIPKGWKRTSHLQHARHSAMQVRHR